MFAYPDRGHSYTAKKGKFFLKYSSKSLIYVTFMLTFSQSTLLRNSWGPILNIVSLFPVISYNKILLIKCTAEERRCRSNKLKRKEKYFWLMCKSPWKDRYTIIPVDLEGQKCFSTSLSTNVIVGIVTILVDRNEWGIWIHIKIDV